MAGIILTGPAGSGKTDFAIQQILAAEAEDQEVWVLLPNRLQGEAFRERMILAAKQNVLLNIRFFEFYELYALLLDLAGEPQRIIGWSSGERILRQVMQGMEMPYYHLIAQEAGFVQLVSGFIAELKQGLMDEKRFADFAQKRRPKDQDLARIYHAYQTFLKDNRLVDRDGAGWVALESLAKYPDLVAHVGLLVVDGFDNFNPLQAALLGQLGRRVEETLVTLSYEAERVPEVGRYFAYTLERLKKTGDWQVQKLEKSVQTPLHHLERQLFRVHPESQAAQGCLELIEAPNPRQEVKAVLREIKRLLLAGVEADSILVVMRDLNTYAEAFRNSAYDLPLTVEQGEALLDNPAVNVILNLIDLHSADFPRRQMLDLLHNPYLKSPHFSPAELDLLERFSLKKPIIGGREKWLAGLESGYVGEEERDDAIRIPAGLIEKVFQFFEELTPPRQATARDYVGWLEGLIGRDSANRGDNPDEDFPAEGWALYRGLRQTSESAILIRDLYALHGFRGAVQEVLSAYDVLESVAQIQQPVTWAAFRADLELALRNRKSSDPRKRSRAGRVLITSVFEGRGLPHDYVFIVGLSEGIFPMKQSEDPLYGDRERLELETQGIDVLTAAERTRDISLFYEMCGLARVRLVLSRPSLDEKGNPWQASPFWKNTVQILSDAPLLSLKIGSALQPEDAANRRELAVALAAAPHSPQAGQFAAYLGPFWKQVLRGRAIELGREDSGRPFDEYSGILQQPDLVAEVARRLGEKRLWSASQFNELGTCPFQFFSKRLLSLEAYQEPEEGFTILQLGSINHKILEVAYQHFSDQQIPIHPDYQAEALAILAEIAPSVLASAPQDFGFQATPFWEQEKINLLEKLKAVVALDFSADSPLHKLAQGKRLAWRQEQSFGDGETPALEIKGAAGTLRVRGFIDRMDLVDGQQLVVVDYKSSKIPTKKEIEEGRNFQMLVYILAAEHLTRQLGYQVEGGLFWSIQRNKTGEALKSHDDLIPHAIEHIHDLLGEARLGRFPNQPSKWEEGKCSTYCDFSQFCRLKRANRYKRVE